VIALKMTLSLRLCTRSWLRPGGGGESLLPFEHEIHAVAAQRVMDLAEVYRAPYRIERAGREGDSR